MDISCYKLLYYDVIWFILLLFSDILQYTYVDYCRMQHLDMCVTKLDEKALGVTRTLRAGCNKAEPKNFAPPQTPFPGAQDGQNLIS